MVRVETVRGAQYPSFLIESELTHGIRLCDDFCQGPQGYRVLRYCSYCNQGDLRNMKHLHRWDWGILFLLLFALAPGMMETATGEAVQYREELLTLPTYPWHDDPHPALRAYDNVIYYPYLRQEHISKTSVPRDYRTLVLENEYLRVTCIPELGGRIHSVLVKAIGQDMFHRNDVIKPALIAMRGAWISGGIEWNAGPHSHTVTAVSPVDALLRDNGDGSATLVVGNTDKIFRMRWTAVRYCRPLLFLELHGLSQPGGNPFYISYDIRHGP